MKFKSISIILLVLMIIGSYAIFEEAKGTNTSSSTEDTKLIDERGYEEKQPVEIQNNTSELTTNENEKTSDKSSNKILNILLLGIDKEENASDTIMILSSNKEKNTVKLISIMRDTYVYQGEGMANKINYAYRYGGIEGSINTINEVFNLDISKYIKVTFDDFVNIVDKLGGIEIHITEKERKYINNAKDTNKLIESGNVILDGKQALVYSRIRKIDSDFNRTERQREVMMAILQKIKNMSIIEYPNIISNLMDSIDTNLSFFELLDIGNYILGLDKDNMNDFRIPIDGTTRDNCNGVYHLDWDRDVNIQALHDFIYN